MNQAIRMENLLEEYITFDHMKSIFSEKMYKNVDYLSFIKPYHSFIRAGSKSTKVRVVFNASKFSHMCLSLNDDLYTDLTLQSDLIIVILNWRVYLYLFNGDIQKMYRQILAHEQDQQFQHIIFRKKNRKQTQIPCIKNGHFRSELRNI